MIALINAPGQYLTLLWMYYVKLGEIFSVNWNYVRHGIMERLFEITMIREMGGIHV